LAYPEYLYSLFLDDFTEADFEVASHAIKFKKITKVALAQTNARVHSKTKFCYISLNFYYVISVYPNQTRD